MGGSCEGGGRTAVAASRPDALGGGTRSGQDQVHLPRRLAVGDLHLMLGMAEAVGHLLQGDEADPGGDVADAVLLGRDALLDGQPGQVDLVAARGVGHGAVAVDQVGGLGLVVEQGVLHQLATWK